MSTILFCFVVATQWRPSPPPTMSHLDTLRATAAQVVNPAERATLCGRSLQRLVGTCCNHAQSEKTKLRVGTAVLMP
jgi:hypothetical protein